MCLWWTSRGMRRQRSLLPPERNQWMSGYPESVSEVLDDTMRFNAAALRAVRAFAASQPWSGTVNRRKEQFRTLVHDLSIAYAIPEPELRFPVSFRSSSTGSCYLPNRHVIVLTKPSVCTVLHEWRHAWQYVTRGRCSERDACRWSINLFRKVWPDKYARLRHEGHMLMCEARNSSRAFPRVQVTDDPESRQ